MNEQPFDDVVMPPQVGSSHGSGFVHMGEASFDSLPALTQQALSALTSDPSTVLIYRLLLFLLADPVPASAVRFGTATPNRDFFQNHQHIITVTALVEHQFGGTFRIQLLRFVVRIGRYFPNMLAALSQRFVQRISITRRRRLQGHGQHCTSFQIHRMLGFVGKVRTAIFHLRNLRIRIMRVLPVVVVALFLPLAVQLCQLFASRSLDAGFFRQTFEKVVVTLTVISAAHEMVAA
jgi:hypothetical protein